jgi:hypothetical protein
VFIVEEYKESTKKPHCRREIELIPQVASLIKKYYPGGKESSKNTGKEFEKELKKLDKDLEVDAWGDIIYKNSILNYDPGKHGMGFDLKRADVIFKNQLERLKKEVESNECDEYKIYYRKNDWVYEGWSDYSGHTRKNRIGYWARPGELINNRRAELCGIACLEI